MLWLIMLVLVPVQTHLIDTPQNITSNSPCIDRNHLFLAPGLLAAGGSSRACVSRFYPEGPARMLLSLQTEDGEVVTATRDLSPGDGGCIDINVPLKPNTKANLNVNLRYPEANCIWNGHLAVRIASSKVVVVHTERVRYRPGDTVRVRVLALKADLTPSHGNVDEIWLEGPRGIWDGVRATQWLRVRTRLGLAQVQHQLDELAPPGKWVVKARLGDGSQGSAAFSVGNYELPPFQLTVRHAPRVLRSSDRLVWTVCVRYPWSEAVEGMLVIRLRGAGTVSDGSTGIRTAVRLKAPRACHRHAAAARRIGLDGVNAPDVVVADFSFQEEGTRIWQNTTVVSQVVEDPVTLEFLTKYRAVISPGLPYKLKVRATRWDDKPAANERVRVCRSAAAATVAPPTCVEGVTDARGVARVLFNAEDSTSPLYKFDATLHNVTASLQLACRGAASRAALGPLRTDAKARTLVPLYLNLGNVTTPLTVHFVVITRGGIIYRWGATTQCPTAAATTQIQTTPRNSNCPLRHEFNVEARNTSDVDSLLERHLLRVMLPIKVSHQMCPDSRVLAFFYHAGELVSASKHFEMEECFGNQVEATWSSRQIAPGSMATLQLSTPGPALCALSVLDTAAKWLQPPDSIRDVIMLALRRLIEAHRNLTEHDAAGECFLTTDMPELPTSSQELMASWLATAGVRVSGGTTVPRKCDPAPELLLSDDVFSPRSDFSEAWLWKLIAVGGNGSAMATARTPDSITRFEANAYCLSRTGIAISQPAVLQVFREFFIHADGPRRLRRGDNTIIRYRLFNYLYDSISIQIQVLTDPHIESSSTIEAACLAGRSAVARRLELRARLPGEARLSIRAKTVRDPSCGNSTGVGVSDEVIIKIQIDPEGIPVHDHKSIMLCGRDTEATASPASISWSWPKVDAVPGTESVTMWATADVTGPLLADADSLVALPRGCGEQNMARLATNLLALTQLHPASSGYVLAKDHVARGFTRQLQYAHPSGGFSAFGPSDPMASTWLTAFCVRYLRKAYKILSPGIPVPPALERAERWLLSQQMENGCFRNDGQVFHRELKGGLNEEGEVASVTLTAYVMTSLIESGLRLRASAVRSALACLRALPGKPTPSRGYAHAVLAYAFVRIKRYEEDLRRTNEAAFWEKKGLEHDEETRELLELLKLAKRNRDYVWWEGATLATSIEATGYALLALRQCPASLRAACAAAAAPAALWLATQRAPAGGFVATQDTLVALEGLTRWSSLQPAGNLTLTARNTHSSKTITLHPNSRVPDVIHVEPDTLDVEVKGVGCALVQASRSYNTVCSRCVPAGALAVQVAVHTDGPFNCDNSTCFCAAVVEACVVWTGQFPEMALLEISLPGGYGADAAKLYSQLNKADTLLRRIELSSSGRATLYLVGGVPGEGGHRCYRVHAVGPRGPTRPAHAHVMDYYAPNIEHSQMYTIPEDCPPRISADTNDYLPSDNLFAKAKSLEDGEIIITHEFSFEDIPEGIPLDDPIYENLTQQDNKDVNKGKIGDENEVRNDSDVNNTDIDNVNSRIENKNVANINSGHIDDDKKIKDIDPFKVKSDKVNETKLHNDSDNEILKDVFNKDDSKIYREALKQENFITSTKHEINDNEKVVITKDKEEIKMAVHTDENVKTKIESNENIKLVNSKNENGKLQVNNPILSDFHVIDSEKDLDVPTGVEGPLPTVVLPPQNFVFIPPNTGHFTPIPEPSRRQFPIPTYNERFFLPYFNRQNYRNRPYGAQAG
ncbi:murinoglobulin-2-like [Epargyreus clarus]|uniref:murinoglobulin-2-like n=1 Tax=Epargyreus clarus TaxID=520877 RepID=UPI003C2C8AA8